MSDDTTPPSYGSAPPPPPPPPESGSVPPPPPPPPVAPPPGSGGYDAIEAIKFGWNRFTAGPSKLLVPTLVVGLAVIVIEVGGFFLAGATLLDTDDCTITNTGDQLRFDDCGGPGFFTTVFAYALIGFLVSLIVSCLGAGLVKCALNLVDGKEVNTGDVFTYATKPAVVTTAAILAVATFVGTLLCYVPGLIVGFLTVFALFFVVDKDMSPVDAIKASVSLVTGNLGSTLLFYVLGIVVIAVGAALCGVGLLAAIPVVVAAAAYTFRTLQNEPVAPTA